MIEPTRFVGTELIKYSSSLKLFVFLFVPLVSTIKRVKHEVRKRNHGSCGANFFA